MGFACTLAQLNTPCCTKEWGTKDIDSKSHLFFSSIFFQFTRLLNTKRSCLSSWNLEDYYSGVLLFYVSLLRTFPWTSATGPCTRCYVRWSIRRYRHQTNIFRFSAIALDPLFLVFPLSGRQALTIDPFIDKKFRWVTDYLIDLPNFV